MKESGASAFINQVLIYTLAMLVFTGSIGLGTVWLRHEISVAANQNQALQTRLAEVQRHLDDCAAEIAAAQSTDNLVKLDARWHLGLVQPRPEQNEYVEGNVSDWFAARRGEGLFTVELQPAAYRRNGSH
jgi:hypothetical protein